jgi:hypothetical protein
MKKKHGAGRKTFQLAFDNCLVQRLLYDNLVVSDIHGRSLIHVKESLRCQTQH